MDPVLVVGEVGDLVQAVTAALGRAGHPVVQAPHAHASAVAARAVAPGVVVVCLPLTLADDRRLLRVLRRYGAGTPVVAVARQLAGAERSRLRAAGADAAVALGADAGALLKTLRSLPRRRRDGRAWSDAARRPLHALAARGLPPGLPRALDGRHRPALQPAARPEEELHVGEIIIRPAMRTVRRAGRLVPLTAREFDVLLCLARRLGQVVTRETLHAEVWGWHARLGTRSADRQVVALRRKLERDPQRPVYLHTVNKFGYRLELVPDTAEPARHVELAG